ncbi:MAG: family 16 glycosylhydrolase [Bacteroidales bacterium]|nr:family 16 glycosylhydrolase [Bacteroidales bacterium]
MKKTTLLFLLLLFVISVSAQTKSLVWSDEFNGSSISSTYWDYDLGNGTGGWGNQELQYYTSRSENAKVQDGNLIITAKKESYSGFDYTSARLVTRNKVSWKYGRIEVRANLPGGTGIWPAVWMLPEVWNYGNESWPDNGEIDIMEYVGYDPGVINASLHNHNNSGSNSITHTINISDVEDNFHVYALEWSENKIEMFVDDTKYFTYNNPGTGWEAWPWDKEFHLLINIAVGGAWGGAEGVDDEIFPQTMEIDYVKVYDLSVGAEELILESASIDTNQVEINLDFNIDMATPLNQNNSFEVLVNNVDLYEVDSVYVDPVNPQKIKIKVKETFINGDVVSLNYTPGNIQSLSGIALEAFQGKLVNNTITGFSGKFKIYINSIYPNPFTNNLFINSDNNIESIEVFDITGNTVYKNTIVNSVNISTSDWKPGVFFIKINTKNKKNYTVKMLKINY